MGRDLGWLETLPWPLEAQACGGGFFQGLYGLNKREKAA